jgi:hypothetical protein
MTSTSRCTHQPALQDSRIPGKCALNTRARRFLRCIPSQVCFELLTRTRTSKLELTRQVEELAEPWAERVMSTNLKLLSTSTTAIRANILTLVFEKA